jgi:hypothetical protein
MPALSRPNIQSDKTTAGNGSFQKRQPFGCRFFMSAGSFCRFPCFVFAYYLSKFPFQIEPGHVFPSPVWTAILHAVKPLADRYSLLSRYPVNKPFHASNHSIRFGMRR